MRNVDLGVRCIQRALTGVVRDRFTPAVLSPQISDYLIDLTIKHLEADEFTNFLLLLPVGAIEKELLRQLLPENLRQPVFNRRAEYDELQRKQETEIVQQNFDKARDYRDQKDRLAHTIREMVSDQELLVTPQLIDSVLKTLGYDDP